MSFAFLILAIVTVASALGAMLFRNPVHCALNLAITFAGLAGLYLHLNAQFVGFVQILVYVGAVAVLIVFAILLTQSSEATPGASVFSSTWWAGVAVTLVLFVVLAAAISSEDRLKPALQTTAPQPTVAQIGDKLLAEYVLPLEVIGLLLTAALIGAVLIALDERPANATEPALNRAAQPVQPERERREAAVAQLEAAP